MLVPLWQLEFPNLGGKVRNIQIEMVAGSRDRCKDPGLSDKSVGLETSRPVEVLLTVLGQIEDVPKFFFVYAAVGEPLP